MDVNESCFKRKCFSPPACAQFFVFALVLAGLYALSLYSYLLFHTIGEMIAVSIGTGIFMIAWNTRRFMENGFFLVLGISSLSIAMLDIVHTLSYKGMNVFVGHDANLPTQLWVASRYTQAFSFLLAFVVMKRKAIPWAWLAGYVAWTAVLLTAIFSWDVFPACYVEGLGLTPFKVASEYALCLALAVAMFFLLRFRKNFDPMIFCLMMGALFFAIFSGLSFTSYVGVYEIPNLIGHFFKIVSFGFLYEATIHFGLRNPYGFLFLEMKHRESELNQTSSLYRALFENNEAVKLLIDPKTADIVDANPAACSFYGYTAEEIKKMKITHIHALPSDRVFEAMRQVLSEERKYFQFRHWTSVGERDVEVYSSPVEIHGKTLLFSIVHDITDRKKMENELGQERNNLQSLIHSAPVGILIVDGECRVIQANRKTERMFGKEVAQFIERRCGHLVSCFNASVHPLGCGHSEKCSRCSLMNALKKVLVEGIPVHEQEMYVVTDAGNSGHLWIKFSVEPVVMNGIRYAIATLDDITGQKKTEVALKASESKYRSLFECNADGILIAEVKTRCFVSANRQICRMFGYSEQEILSLKVDDIHPRENTGIRVREFERMARKEKALSENVPCLHKDGTIFFVDINAACVEIDGKVCCMGMFRDITRRKETEEKLKRNEEFFRTLFSSKIVGIILSDISGHITLANDAFLEMLGYSREELPLRWDQMTPPEWKEQDRLAVESVKRGKDIPAWEKEYFRKDGSRLSVLMGATAMKDDPGKALCFAIDITGRKEMEKELHQAKERAEAATEAKSKFLANMSHEIRTPLNAIVNMTDLLLGLGLSPEQRDYAHTLKGASEILLSLISDILDFSKIEAEKLHLENVEFDLEEVIEETARIIGVRTDEKGLKLVCRVENIHSALRGDPNRLRQILLNLLSNAVKFTERGEVRLRVSVERESDPHLTLRFEISDTGIGIPPGTLPNLFQPFAQADTSITRKFGGTGLGLSIAARLVEMMEGEIGAESEEGKGSLFWFTARFEKKDASETREKTPSSGSFVLDKLPDVRILLVEDNLFNQKVAIGMLKKLGLRADIAKNGKEALEMLVKTNYDLVLMDIQMPEMDGVEATKRIRAMEPPNRDLSIIAMTADAMKGSREYYLDNGFDDYVIKPVSFNDLLGAIRRQTWKAPGMAEEPLTQEPTESVLDRESLLDRLGRDETMVAVILEMAKTEIPEQIGKLKEALAKRDAASVRMEAHTLKGMCANLGARRMEELACAIELAGKRGNLEAGTFFSFRLDQEFKNLKLQIR